MKRIYFDTEAEYEAYLQENPVEAVWAVYDYDGEYACDVTGTDQNYLFWVGFIDGNQTITHELTPAQLALFKENYGVEIFIIEERIKLTKKQLEVVKHYNEAVRQLKNANIVCVFKPYESILAINGEYIEDVSYEEDCSSYGTDATLVDVDATEVIGCPFGINLSLLDDNSFTVQFKPPRAQ